MFSTSFGEQNAKRSRKGLGFPTSRNSDPVVAQQATYSNQALLQKEHTDKPPITPLRPSEQVVLQRKCAACEKDALPNTCSSNNLDTQEAPPVVHQVLTESGRPLDASSRTFFEPRLGLDLGHVRLHDDALAAHSARAVNARAFTVGNHIAIADGIDTTSASGRRLLAHELTHVLQQGDGSVQGKLVVGESNNVYEQEADRVADQVISMPDAAASAVIRATATVTQPLLQRDDAPDPDDPFKDPTKKADPLTGPGGPLDTNDKGFTCGWENGKFTCHPDIGKGDPLSLPGTWPSPSKNPPNVKGSSSCPPGKYNKLWMSCCRDGSHASADGFNCVPDQQPQAPTPIPPLPDNKGDFPTVSPGGGMQYA